MIRKQIFLLFCAFFSLVLSGCLYTTHNYNTGRIMKQGKSGLSIGYGRQKVYDFQCEDDSGVMWGELVKKDGKISCRYIDWGDSISDTSYNKPDVKQETIPDMSISYRLGIRDTWGPFTGLETGFLFQVPTMPISAEFFLKLGLPDKMWVKTKHAIALGYIIGFWADNTYYLEYAASREFGKLLWYTSFRSTLLATQMFDTELEGADGEFKLGHKRRFIHQLTLGFLLNIPELPVLPDYVTPQANLIYPNLPIAFEESAFGYGDDLFNLKWNVGFGWNF